MENYKEKLVRYLKDNATTKKAEILKSIEDYKACIKILEWIKRVHKKDGSDFQNVLKNFEMPEGSRIYWELVVFTNELRISAYPHKIYLNWYETDEAKVQAKKLGHSLKMELVRLSVHSLLHLLGYDHIKEEDRKVMHPKEVECMKKAGYEIID